MDEILEKKDLVETAMVGFDRKKQIAPESSKTKKIREKLLEQWAEQDSQITASALAQTIEKIHQWIASNSMHRVVLKNKAIRLFDQNQNAASLSQKIRQIAERISMDSR